MDFLRGDTFVSFSKTMLFVEKNSEASYLKNYYDLCSHIWRQVLRSFGVLWQHQSTELGPSNFVNCFVGLIPEKKLSRTLIVLSRTQKLLTNHAEIKTPI